MKQITTIILIGLSLSLLGQGTKDVFEVNNLIIELLDTDSVHLTDYFENQKSIDSISKQYSNWLERSLAIEKHQIDEYKLKITIDNNSRIVELIDGSKIKLEPNDSKDEKAYTFEKSFVDNGFLLFLVLWYEGNSYFLLDVKTGQKYYTIGKVFFNKNGQYVMSINDDIDAGYSKNGFQLFSIDNENKMEEIWYYDSVFAPTLLEWIDDENILIRGYTSDASSNWNPKTIYKKIKITKR